jgi:hypothetical protein
MKQKTVRLLALAGILTTSWLLAERPGYALAPCSEVHGQSCDICCARCLSDEGVVKVCTCEDGSYNCHI